MVYPIDFMVHTCVITQRRSVGVDAYGQPILQETKLDPRPCRMSSASTRNQSGVVYTAKCSMQPATDVAADDLLTCANTGFARQYWVNSVKQVTEPTSDELSHTILELRETEGKEIV